MVLNSVQEPQSFGNWNWNTITFGKKRGSMRKYGRRTMTIFLKQAFFVKKIESDNVNKTGTSKVGAIFKAQKAQTFWNCKRGDPLGFLKKKKNRKKNFEPVSQCRKIWKGRPFGLFETSICCKISKNLKGGPFVDKKKFWKKSHSAEKNRKAL